MNPDGIEISNPELLMLLYNKQDAFMYRRRRAESWTENYTLYRGEVQYNRLTQRQTVALPLMKTQLRTLMKDIDDMPLMYFENLDNDKQAELFKNEYWKLTLEQNKADLKDIVDKRQVMFFGRTFDQWQIVDGKVKWSIVDPEDMGVSRYCDPTDIDSSRYLFHTHIFVPLATLKQNPDYDQEAVARLETFYATAHGLIKAKTNMESLVLKNQKLVDLGLTDVDSPILGETYVELTLHFIYHTEGTEDEEIYVYVEADQMEVLMKKRQEELIGVTKDHFWKNHYVYTSWADDVDMQDFWTDGVADILRPMNLVVNTWYSQMIENRTLRNFGMNYYDGTAGDGEFSPQTFDPKPFGWYKLPGPPQDIVQNIQIPDLGTESLDELNFLITQSEKATGATAGQQGVAADRQVTLGEFKATLSEAQERVQGMSKFYTPAWKDRGTKFAKLVEAAGDKLDAVTIYKKGRNTDNVYKREISNTDWETESGYICKVWSQDEKDTDDMNMIQKLSLSSQYFIGNPKFTEIQQRKLLEYDGLNPDQIIEIMQFEEQKRQAMAAQAQAMQGMPGQPMQPGQPAGAPGMPMLPPAPGAPQPGGGMLPAPGGIPPAVS